MRILAEMICQPARQVLESEGHTVSTIAELLNGAVAGQPIPQSWDVIWSRLEPLQADGIGRSDIKYIACPCTDVSHLPLAECQRHGIKVLSLCDTGVLPTITATAEHTIGLILALVRKIPSAAESVKRGEWERYRFMGRELKGMLAFVLGSGRIGTMVKHGLSGLGVDVRTDQDGRERDWYLRRAEIVTMHVDLNDSTRGMCNAEFFAAMKPGAFFVNTSRGQVVDESALLAALRSGHLAGAALDVVCGEPDQINPELIAFANEQPDRLLITPHIAGCCVESIEKAECALAARLVEEL